MWSGGLREEAEVRLRIPRGCIAAGNDTERSPGGNLLRLNIQDVRSYGMDQNSSHDG
jgi:hypothetical protein